MKRGHAYRVIRGSVIESSGPYVQPGELFLSRSGGLYEVKQAQAIATIDLSRHKFVAVDLENVIPTIISLYDFSTEDRFNGRDSRGVLQAQPDFNNSLYSLQTSKVRSASIITSTRPWTDLRGVERRTTYGYGVQNVSIFLNGGDIGAPAIIELFSGKEGRIQVNSDSFRDLSRQLAILVALSQAYSAHYNAFSLGSQWARAAGLMSTQPIVNPFSKFYVNLPDDAFEFDLVTNVVNLVVEIGGQRITRLTSDPSFMPQNLQGDLSIIESSHLAVRSEVIFGSGYTGSGSGNSNGYSVSYSSQHGFTYSGSSGPGYGGMPSSLSGSVSW